MNTMTQRTWALTEIQRAYFVGRQESRDGTRILYEFRCSDPVDLMEKALNRLVAEQAALQIVFTRDGRQRLSQEVAYYPIEQTDLSHLTEEEAEEYLLRDFNRTSRENYDIFHWPLFSMKAFRLPEREERRADQERGRGGETIAYQFGIDMMVADASSLRFLIHRVIQYAKGLDWAPGEMDRSFLDYCNEKERERHSEDGARGRDRDFWMKKLGTFPGPPDFPPAEKRGARRNYARKKMEAASAQWEALLERVRRMRLTPSAYLLGAYAMTVGIYSGQKEFALNLPVFDRLGSGGRGAVGDFTSILLVPVSMQDADDFAGFCRKLQFRMIDALRHRRFSGLEFMRELARDRESGSLIYPVVFTSMINEEQQLDIDDKQYAMTRGYSQTSQVILDCQIMANRNRLFVFWDYDRNAFAEGLIDRMFRHFCAIVTDDTEELQSLEAEKGAAWEKYEACMDRRSLKEARIPDSSLPGDARMPGGSLWGDARMLGGSLPEYARTQPDAAAVIDADGTETTYAELERMVETVAAGLQLRGLGRGDGVMIPAVKTAENFAAILAVLRCGAFYVPYMPGTPDGRYADMKSMSGARMDLTEELREELMRAGVPGNPLHDTFVPFCPVTAEPEDMAYIIFTSGSTGKPKGVMITHAQAMNTIRDINERFHVGENDRILGISELTFDLSVYDLFGAIMAGAAVVFTRNHHQMKEIRRQMSRYRITVWNSVPALMSLLLDTEEEPAPYYRDFYHKEKRVPRTIYNYESLRLVLLSGDYIPVTLPDRIRKMWPHSEVISLGGATEGAIWSIFYPIGKVNRNWTTIPYGYPLSGQTMYVLDLKGNPAPPSTVGEICIGGAGVAKGYAGSRELTERAFIEHPELGRIYRTGDYGMLNAAGWMEFMGRRDQQVKINGYRVELDEISSKAMEMDGIGTAVALSAGTGGRVLNLYYTVSESGTPGNAFGLRKPEEAEGLLSGKAGTAGQDQTARKEVKERLRRHLEKELLSYMVPRNLYEVASIPLTANGKVDRKALLLLTQDAAGSRTCPPADEKEEKIFRLFGKVLGREDFGVEDDFFDLGGDSLKGIELFNLLEDTYEISLAQLFQYRTVRSLANQISEKDVFEDRLGAFLGKLQSAMSDEEDTRALDLMEKQRMKKGTGGEDRIAEETAGETGLIGKSQSVSGAGRNYRGILLTGSTGYLGAYLVRELLERTDATLHLLIRGSNPEEKLAENLEYYFGREELSCREWIRNHARIRIWKGEFSLPDEGMTKEEDAALWSGVDAVFHCGAKTTHYGKPEDFQKVNVDSTRFLLEKCLARGADFFFVSSTRVLDNDVTDKYQIFDEDARTEDFLARELYSDSKIRSEKLIEEYRKKGVRCTIFRTGTIVFDSRSGLLQRNHAENAFYIVLRAFLKLQFIPDIRKKALDLSFVDQVAEAMVTLMLSAPGNRTWHVFNPHRLSSGELGRMLAASGLTRPPACIPVDSVMKRMQQEDEEKRRIMELAILHSASYIPASGGKSRVVCGRTAEALRRMGFTWLVPDPELIGKMVRGGL